MTKEHPITPPPWELEQWDNEAATAEIPDQLYIATQAARWGADQELEACRLWVSEVHSIYDAAELLNQRRPKPPNLKEQALEAAQRFYALGHEDCSSEEVLDDYRTIRRALEALPDDPA